MKESLGIILEIRKFSESSAIITIISEHFGIINGLVKGAFRPKTASTYQIGNLVYFKHFGKNDNLGLMSCEIQRPFGAMIMINRYKLYILNLTIYLILIFFPIGSEINNVIYKAMLKMLYILENTENIENFSQIYQKMEIFLCKKIGFENQNLEYIFEHFLNKKMPQEFIRLRNNITQLSIDY